MKSVIRYSIFMLLLFYYWILNKFEIYMLNYFYCFLDTKYLYTWVFRRLTHSVTLVSIRFSIYIAIHSVTCKRTLTSSHCKITLTFFFLTSYLWTILLFVLVGLIDLLKAPKKRIRVELILELRSVKIKTRDFFMVRGFLWAIFSFINFLEPDLAKP